MNIRYVTVYTGNIPDKATQTKEEFAENIYNTHKFYDTTFVTDINNTSSDINDFVDIFNDRFAFANYKGIYDATKTYMLGESVHYDGMVYYSNIDNNTGNQPDTSSDWISSSASHTHDYSEILNAPINVSDLTNDAGYLTTVSWGIITGKPALYTQAEIDDMFNNFDALPDQTNNTGKWLKTDGSVATWTAPEWYTQSEVDTKIANIDALPDQTNNVGKFLQTDGSNANWVTIDAVSIDDESLSDTTTFSSNEINRRIENLVVTNSTAPAPQLSVDSITADEQTSVTFQISNYDSSHTYSQSVSNTDVADISRTDADITVTFKDVSADTTIDIKVTNFEDGYDYAGEATIPATIKRVLSTTTETPTTDKTTITGNSQEVITVLITNYDSSFTYTLSVANDTVATVTRTDDTLTVTLAQTEVDKSTTLTISAFDPTKELASTLDVPVNVTGVVVTTDELIQIVDFSTVESSSVDMDTTGTLKALSDDAEYVSTALSQEDAEPNWISYQPSLVKQGDRLTSAGFVSNKIVTSQEGVSSILITDVLDVQYEKTITNIVAPTTGDKTAFTDFTADGGENKFGNMYDGAVSFDGTIFYTIYYNGTNNISMKYATASTPYDATTLSDATEVSLPLPTDESFYYPSAFSFSSDGKHLYILDTRFTLGQYKGLHQYILSTPWDVSTATYVATADVNKWVDDWLSTSTNYDFTDTYYQRGVHISHCGKYIIVTSGRNGNSFSVTISVSLATPFDITTADGIFSRNTYDTLDFYNIWYSLDGKQQVIILYDDDGGAFRDFRIYDLDNPFEVMSGSVKAYTAVGDSTNPLGVFFSYDGKYAYIFNYNNGFFNQKAQTGVINTLQELEYDNSDIPRGIKDVYTVPHNLVLKVDTDPSDDSQLDVVNTTALTQENEEDQWHINTDGTATKTVTYPKASADIKYLDFYIAAGDNSTIKSIKFDLEY